MADGSIKIDTKIDQAGVKKGLNEMNTSVRDTMGKLATFGKASLGVMAAAIGAIAAATGKWLKEADRIDKVSQQIGVTKKTFQELDYVMMQNGASIDAFSMGAKTLQQNMVSNSQAFKTLGVEIRNTDGSLRSQDDVMKDVIRKFETMEQGVEKSALAQDIFGRSAQDLMPMLNQQAGGMDELIKKANDMGAVMSDDAVTAAVALGDTIADLKTSISSLLNTVIAPFVPALQKVAEWMSNLSGSVSGTIGMHTNLGKETNTLLTATNNYKTAVENLDGAQKDITDTERTLLKGRKELARVALEKALAETSKGYAKTTEQVAKLKKEEADRIAALGRQSLLMKQLEIIANGSPDAARDAGAAFGLTSIESAREVYAAEARRFEAENLKLIETQTKLAVVSTEQAEAIAEIARAVNDGTINIDIYKKTNRALYDEIMASAEAQKLLNETIEDAPEGGTDPDGGNGIEARNAAQIEARKAAQAEYEKAIDISNAKANAGLITQEENTNNVNSAARRYMDTLLSLGYRFGDMTTLGGQALEQLREDLMLTTEEVDTFTTSASAQINAAIMLALAEIERQARLTKAAGIDAAKTFLVNFAKGMKANLSKATTAVKNAVGNIAKAVGTGFKLFSSLIRFDPQDALDDLEIFLEDIETFFIKTLPGMPACFKSGIEMIADFLRGMMNQLPQIVIWLFNALVQISDMIIAYGPQIINDAGTIILSLLTGLVAAAPKLIEAALAIITSLATFILDNLPEIIMAGVQMIVALINGLGQALPSLIYAIVNALPEIISAIITAFPMIVQAIVDNLPAIIEAVLYAIPMIRLALILAIPELLVAIGKVAYSLVEGLLSGIVAALSGLFKGIGDLFWEWIIKPIRDIFDMHSPSVVFFGLGGDMIQGLINGILSAGGAIWGAVKGIFTGLWDNIKNVFSGAKNLGSSIVSGIGNGIKGFASGAVDLAKGAGSAIVSGVKSAGSAIASGASALASGAGKVLGKLKFWATGTESAPPGFAVVGENGPELVQMNGGERIYPAGETSSILSSIMGGLQSFMGGGSLGGSNGLTIHNMITAPVVIDGRQTARAVYENWDKVAR